MDDQSPLAWRESAAITDMHSRLAAKKLNVMMTKDGVDPDKLLSEFGKAIECLEAAHDAAMRAHAQLSYQARRKQTVRGVRLTRVRDPASEPRPLKAAIGDIASGHSAGGDANGK